MFSWRFDTKKKSIKEWWNTATSLLQAGSKPLHSALENAEAMPQRGVFLKPCKLMRINQSPLKKMDWNVDDSVLQKVLLAMWFLPQLAVNVLLNTTVRVQWRVPVYHFRWQVGHTSPIPIVTKHTWKCLSKSSEMQMSVLPISQHNESLCSWLIWPQISMHCISRTVIVHIYHQ